MSKVKRGLVLPDKPPLNTEPDDPDEDDDEIDERMSAEGLMAAADDLSVADFFAGCALMGLGGVDLPPEALARKAYERADAILLERARRDGNADEDDEDDKT